MIVDCEASLVVAESPSRFSRAKVGIGKQDNEYYLVVITNQFKDKFRITSDFVVRMSTITFHKGKKSIMIRNANELMLKSLMKMIEKLAKRNGEVMKLPKVNDLMKQKPTTTSLVIKGQNFNLKDIQNQQLRSVNASDMKLVPRLIYNLKNLNELTLTNCNLDEVSTKLFQLGNSLRVLNLSNNQIDYIDGSFMLAFKSLKYLNLSKNKLKFIPFEIMALKDLVYLDLKDNDYDNEMPFTIGRIASIRTIHLFDKMNEFSYSLMLHLKTKPFLELHINIKDSNDYSYLNNLNNHDKQPLSLMKLSASSILSNSNLMLSCHQFLPKTLYHYLQYNCEMCSQCYSAIAYKDFFQLKRLCFSDWFGVRQSVSFYCGFGSNVINVLKYNCINCHKLK